MINKKGLGGQEALLIVILGLVILFVLWPIAGDVISKLSADAETEKCRLSVISHYSIIGRESVSLMCPRGEVVFSNNMVTINKKEDKSSFKTLNDDAVNRVVAEEMRKCWYKMGAGEINVFKNNIVYGQKRVCMVCTGIKFDSSVTQSSFKGLNEYLKNKMPNSEMSYYDYMVKLQKEFYFGGFSGLPFGSDYTYSGYITTSRIPNYIVLDKNKEYAIFFLALKPSELADKIKAIDALYFIGLGLPDELPSQCDILEN